MNRILLFAATAALSVSNFTHAQDEAITVEGPPAMLTGLKAEAAEMVGDNSKLTQEIVDSLFSFGELGFQEFETQRYLTEILEGEDAVVRASGQQRLAGLIHRDLQVQITICAGRVSYVAEGARTRIVADLKEMP